jgi:hypothetical protein
MLPTTKRAGYEMIGRSNTSRSTACMLSKRLVLLDPEIALRYFDSEFLYHVKEAIKIVRNAC